jgi:hypothetical protein
LFEYYNWNNELENKVIIAKWENNQWNFNFIDKGRIYFLAYMDANSLEKFTIIVSDPLKTIVYKAKEGLNKKLELDGIWTYIKKVNQYSIYLKSYRPYDRGKTLKIIKDGADEGNITHFNHDIVAIGSTGWGDNIELYAFGHDEIGDNLYIYKSSDGGKNWNLFKTVKNFNYQINYIREIRKENDNIYCKLRVNNYSFDIESKDSFNTWEMVKTNYRINNKIKNKDYLERRERDGSVTIFKRTK